MPGTLHDAFVLLLGIIRVADVAFVGFRINDTFADLVIAATVYDVVAQLIPEINC